MPHRGNGENNEEGSGSGGAAAAPEMTTWLRLTRWNWLRRCRVVQFSLTPGQWLRSALYYYVARSGRAGRPCEPSVWRRACVCCAFGWAARFRDRMQWRRSGLPSRAQPTQVTMHRAHLQGHRPLSARRSCRGRSHEADFASPMARAYYSLGRRLDDGNMHTIRLQYISASGGSLTVFVDDMNVPQLHVSPIDFGRYALNDDGEGLAGFTAASGTGTDDAVTVEVHSWQLAASEVAHEANAARFPKSPQSSASPAAIREEYSAALAGLQPLEAATRGPST